MYGPCSFGAVRTTARRRAKDHPKLQPLHGREASRGLRRGTKRKRYTGNDPEDGGDKPPKDKIHVRGEHKTFEDYLKIRRFIFVHHYCRPRGTLGAAQEAGRNFELRVELVSSDIELGHDLLKETLFTHHVDAAINGLIDGYHAGFPCATLSKLRWREAPGMPRPLRSKSFPYGFPDLNKKEAKDCDGGTVMMARSCNLADAICKTGSSRCPALSPWTTLRHRHTSNTSQRGTCLNLWTRWTS